jgi:hypothetical protein
MRSNLADFSIIPCPSRRTLAILAVLCAAPAAVACSSLPFMHDATPHCPVALVPSQELEDGLRLRVRFHATTPESSMRVEAAVEVQHGTLTLAAFNPFGTRVFAITQRGTELEIEGALGRHMGVRPVLLLDAIHRAILLPSPGRSPWRWKSESVEERRDAGRLEQRVFRSLEAKDADAANTPPEGEDGHAELGAHVEYRVLESVEALDITNDWCPYEARIVILARSDRAAVNPSPAPGAVPKPRAVPKE